MVVRSLEVSKVLFQPQEENEERLGPEIPYLSAIGALMYLANATRPGIAFSVNLLERYSSSPTRRHWNGVKDILQYLKGTSDMCYLFTYGGTTISWRSTKQSIVAISSNHVEIIAIHEASRECVWLRSVTHFIKERYDLKCDVKVPTVLFEDNATCIAQLRGGFIKGDRTKHISPKLFFTDDLQKNGDIDVQ
ncbi:secreted RxLR effector protein 161-like [Solanum verrucosum]|uniref:secreted RxLR effector protein 161-like n=1 Tax=Solanum verrucosum TaxID=315347 RepID=UPI0020D0113A|nr:secreted RxLR effector protein 161-like [Solanum verrucosum]